MATNREMLKEAIAEAKAVKEMAIANAKAALEESFTPQLKSMLSLKLQEMEKEDLEEENIEEEGYGKMNAEPETGFSSMGEKALDEEEMEEGEGENMYEVDLEELLAELELEEGEVEENINEAEEGEEEEGEEEGEEESNKEMEDLSDDELKEMIEDVIAQMIKDGELQAGSEFEGEEEGEEMEMGAEESEEEVDLAELLREIEEMEEMDKMKEPVDEIFGLFKTNNLQNYLIDKKGVDKATAKKIVDDIYKNPNDESTRAELLKYVQKDDYNDFVAYIYDKKSGLTGLPAKDATDIVKAAVNNTQYVPRQARGGGSTPTSKLEETDEMKAELEEALSTIETLKAELNEINLLNAKLLYSNKIFKAKNLNENQKVKVLSSFDKAKNVGEVKMVYETLNEGIKVKKETIKENLGRASKATNTPTTKQPIVESNDVFKRMQKLAGLI
jgi:hypothetical protein